MGVSEHWKSTSQLRNYAIRGFKLATSFCRDEGAHGGSAIFLREDFRSRIRTDVNKLAVTYDFECCACEFTVFNTKITFINIYRAPNGNFISFLKSLEEAIMVCNVENSIIIISGDFNCNLLERNNEVLDFLSLINSYNLKHTIEQPTRITPMTATCIDNILTSYEGTYDSEVIYTSISDHLALKITLQLEGSSATIYRRRMFSMENKLKFKNRVESINWDPLYQLPRGEVDLQWNVFMSKILMHYHECFPIKSIVKRKKGRKQQCMNIRCNNPELCECYNKLTILYILSTVDNRYSAMYKKQKREYNKMLTDAKARHFDNRIITSDNKCKAVWGIVNEIKGRTSKKNDNNFTTSQGNMLDIANKYNDFFKNTSVGLLSHLEQVPFSSDISSNPESMSIKSVTVGELSRIIAKLKNTYSSGHDDVSVNMVKFVHQAILEPICWVVNNSLEFGIFPEQLKLALVIPVHKKGDTTEMSNYRPISLLPSFSKIFEAVMKERIVQFMTSNKLLNDIQHGYQVGKSTTTAIFQFTQSIFNTIENESIPLGLFLDLSKAYDTINHEILLNKLELYGIRGVAREWMRSYLCNRKQMVVMERDGERVRSDIDVISAGIPQGSVLGPILFVVYINDINEISNRIKNCSLTNYADDTNVLISGHDLNEIRHDADHTMADLIGWFQKNKLVLNKDKTRLILFKTNRSKIDTPEYITTAGQHLNLGEDVKFLGVVLDETLCWDSHIEQLTNRLNSMCYSLWVVSKYIGLKARKTVYYANIESLIRYGIIFYGRGRDIQRIFILQKRALRTILGLKSRETCRGKFRENRMLTVTAIYIQECVLFFFKNRPLFNDSEPQADYNVRNTNYTYPKHRLTMTERSAYYNCIKLFNSLPQEFKVMSSLRGFKGKLLEYLLMIEPYDFREYYASVTGMGN